MSWMVDTARWRKHVEEFSLEKLDATTIRHLRESVRGDIARTEVFLDQLRQAEGLDKEIAEVTGELLSARNFLTVLETATPSRSELSQS
jgi:hypothetical protein